MDCNFIDLEIHVRTANRAQLALSLLFMGAVYSNACRIAVCTHPDRACTACFDRSECFWRRVFGQELSTDPAALKRHQKPPLPFVFSFLQCSIPPDTPGILVCGLVVVGCAISCLGMLLKGFSSLLDGDSCPVQAEVVHLFTRDYQGTPTALVTCDQAGTATNLTVLSSAGLLESHAWNSDHCTLRLLSPLKLRFADRLLRRFDFSLFARSLMRRVSALVYYYENVELGLDFRQLSCQIETITCIEDRFHHEAGFGCNQQLAGVMGQGSFKGDFSGLVPFLVLGGYFHVGKNSSCGFGDFMILDD